MPLTRSVSDYKESVKAASVGANIDLSAAPNTLDGISLSANDRVLVKDNTPSSLNGIYRVTTLGTGSNGSWTRASDFNDYRQVTSGVLTFVEQGNINGNVFYYIAGGIANVQIGTTSINFSNLYSFIDSTNTLQGVTTYGNSTTNIISISNTTAATNTTTGALIVSGGAGIGGNLFVGGNLSIFGNTTFINAQTITTTDTIAAPALNAGTIGNSGATFTGATSTLTGASQAASFTTSSGGQLIGYHTGAIGANAANTGAFTTLSASGVTTLNNYTNIYIATGSTNNTSAVTIVGNIFGQGGAGYLDIFKFQNTFAGGTNPNKYLRLDSAGTIQIINSAYNNNIFNLTDAGDLTVAGKLTMSTGVFYSNGTPYSSGGGGGGTPGGSNTMVQFNNSGSFAGATFLQYNVTSGNLVSNSSTASTSQTTGAIVVGGGIGVGGAVYADTFRSLNNGNGTNYYIGDDAVLGDINVANTTRLMGQQDATQGYIIFGNTNNTNYIGRSGSNPITATGAFNVTGTLTGVGQVIGYFNGAIGANTANSGAFTTVTTTGNLYGGGNIIAASGTTSTSTTTGALVISGSGGLGLGGNINASGYIVANGFYNESTTSPGLYIGNAGTAPFSPRVGFFNGNANANWQIDNFNGSFRWFTPGITRLTIDYFGNLSLPGAMTITNNSPATSTTTGALTISGGMGLGGNLYVGGNLSVGGNTTFINAQTITTTDTIAAPAISAGTIGNTGATFSGSTISLTSSATAASFTTSGGGQHIGYHTGAIGANGANTGAFTTLTATTITATGGVSGVAQSFNSNPASVDAGRIFAIYNTNYMPGASYGPADTRILDIGVTTGNIAYFRHSGSNGLQFYVGGNGTSFNNALLPTSNASINIGGTGSNYWSTVYAVSFVGTSTTARYADLAEMYHADDYYAPGTVMVFGGDLDVTISKFSHDTRIAGVVSTNPAYLMNDNFEQDDWLPIALTGRVPCFVRGPVNKGDILVSSDVNGVAQKLDKSKYEIGCVLGKSLDIINDNSIKKIEIAVGRF